MTLEKSDIWNIGHTIYKDDDENVVFVCYPSIAGIEKILLRNILKKFGDYKIIDTSYDYEWDEIQIKTNITWTEIKKV